MKKCPFCAEEIQDDAIKCRYCNEFLDENIIKKEQIKWYFTPSIIRVVLLCTGPFVLPLIWFHPKYSKTLKIIYSIAIIAVSIGVFFLIRNTYLQFKEVYDELYKELDLG